ncbi:MAG: acyltransferase [Planctomycetota bacterium]|nr:MAG: acyltransferase [Planctomycetota bacterium]
MPADRSKLPAQHYRPDVDGLRAVAVLSVLFCHTGMGLPGGYVGVDVFFVISGYLITGLILKDLDQGRFSLVDFWERRIRRIVPALVVVTIVTVALGWRLLLPDDFASLAKSAIALPLCIANIHFWKETGYFEAAAEEKPLLHTWSLAVEEQFYLLVPLVLMAVAKMYRAALVPLLSLACAASFALSVYGVANHPDATYYLLPTRAWELLVGALLAGTAARMGPDRPWRGQVAAAVGMSAILLSCFLYSSETPFPGLAATLPVLGTALVIAAGGCATPAPAVNAVLAGRPLVFIGLISYSLYLWHWPLLALSKACVFTPLSIGQRLTIIAASVAAAALSWRFVETPFRNRAQFASRAGVFVGGALGYGVILALGIAIDARDGYPERLTTQAERFAVTCQRDEKYTRGFGLKHIPHELTRLGPATAAPSIAVWGDSHAMAILPAMDELGKRYGVTTLVATHSATAPVLDFYARRRFGLNENAIPFNAAVFNTVIEQKIKSVVLAAVWSNYFREPDFGDALLTTVEKLAENGVTVYFVKDVPYFSFNVPRALTTYAWHGWTMEGLGMPVEDYDLKNSFHAEFLPELERRGAIILDPLPLFLRPDSPGKIVPYDDVGSRYADAHHLSTHGALAIQEVFLPLFADAAPPDPAQGLAAHDSSGAARKKRLTVR